MFFTPYCILTHSRKAEHIKVKILIDGKDGPGFSRNVFPFYILTFLCLPGQCILDGVVSIFLPSQFKYELVLAGIIALLLE